MGRLQAAATQNKVRPYMLAGSWPPMPQAPTYTQAQISRNQLSL